MDIPGAERIDLPDAGQQNTRQKDVLGNERINVPDCYTLAIS